MERRLCNGQRLQFDEEARGVVRGLHVPRNADADYRASVYHGLLGGYAFYDTLASTRLLQLADAVELTVLARERVRPPQRFAALPALSCAVAARCGASACAEPLRCRGLCSAAG